MEYVATILAVIFAVIVLLCIYLIDRVRELASKNKFYKEELEFRELVSKNWEQAYLAATSQKRDKRGRFAKKQNK